MAVAGQKVSVAVEAALHKALRSFLESVLVEHGLRINSVNVDWIALGTVNEPTCAVVNSMRIETQS